MKIDKGTIIRTVALILALANQTVAIIGATTFANAAWYQILSFAVLIASSLFAAWKNNDFTYFAKLATGVLHALKDGKITEDEVNELLNK